MPARRCPYLGEFFKESRGPLRVYRFDCNVVHRSNTKWAWGDRPPICVRDYENCHLFQGERGREDELIRRYTE